MVKPAASSEPDALPFQRGVVAPARVDLRADVPERRIEARRERALLARQVPVGGRQRESVALAHDRAADDLDREKELLHEAPNDHEFLKIPLAEHGHVGPHDIEELDLHRAQCAEVARRPERPLEDVLEAWAA